MIHFIFAAIIAVTVDLWTKKIAFDFFETHLYPTPVIDSFLYWTRAENTGVAFGMLQGKNDILSYILPIILLGLPIYIFINRKDPKLQLLLLGFVYGGAIGNYYDRITHGYVRDFIDVRLFSYNYPVFNIADAFISCSVVLLIIVSWIEDSKIKKSSKLQENTP